MITKQSASTGSEGLALHGTLIQLLVHFPAYWVHDEAVSVLQVLGGWEGLLDLCMCQAQGMQASWSHDLRFTMQTWVQLFARQRRSEGQSSAELKFFWTFCIFLALRLQRDSFRGQTTPRRWRTQMAPSKQWPLIRLSTSAESPRFKELIHGQATFETWSTFNNCHKQKAVDIGTKTAKRKW